MEPQTKLDPITETALRSLKDIAFPAPVLWVPHTWGWALLAVVLALAIIGCLAAALRRYRRNAYRREALHLLSIIERQIGDPSSASENLTQLPELLKRTALAAWPREKVARVTGPDWISLLDRSQGTGIGHGLSRLLKETEYRGGDEAVSSLSPRETENIVADARRWIEGHDVRA